MRFYHSWENISTVDSRHISGNAKPMYICIHGRIPNMSWHYFTVVPLIIHLSTTQLRSWIYTGWLKTSVFITLLCELKNILIYYVSIYNLYIVLSIFYKGWSKSSKSSLVTFLLCNFLVAHGTSWHRLYIGHSHTYRIQCNLVPLIIFLYVTSEVKKDLVHQMW